MPRQREPDYTTRLTIETMMDIKRDLELMLRVDAP
jgi:hypothetical protein